MIENTLKSATNEINKFFHHPSLFRNETHYLVISVILSLCTVTYFFHLPAHELVAITQKSAYINFFSNLPATNFQKWIEGVDVNFWNAYYIAQFSTAPAHIGLGIMGSFFLPEKKYKVITKEISFPIFCIAELIFLSVLLIIIFTPQVIAGYPIPINYWQPKSIFPNLAFTWLIATLIFYGCGIGFTAPIHKLRFRNYF